MGRIAGTTFGRPIAGITAFTFHADEPAVHDVFQVEGKVRLRYIQHLGNLTGNQTFRGILDQ